MRLIDADALIEQLREADRKCSDDIIKACIGLVQTQPTAYDVEKVVAGIEEFYEEAEHYGFASALSDIVEVVKWGGINE